MNGNFYQNPTFPNNANPINMEHNNIPNNITLMNSMPMESTLENILRINISKRVNVYATFPNSNEWQNKTFSGIIEEVGNDYFIISDPTNGNWYLIKLDNLDYIEFMEHINN